MVRAEGWEPGSAAAEAGVSDRLRRSTVGRGSWAWRPGLGGCWACGGLWGAELQWGAGPGIGGVGQGAGQWS